MHKWVHAITSKIGMFIFYLLNKCINIAFQIVYHKWLLKIAICQSMLFSQLKILFEMITLWEPCATSPHVTSSPHVPPGSDHSVQRVSYKMIEDFCGKNRFFMILMFRW